MRAGSWKQGLEASLTGENVTEHGSAMVNFLDPDPISTDCIGTSCTYLMVDIPMTETLDSRAQRFVPLRPPVLEILLTLAEGPLHGYAIIRALRDEDGAKIRVETGPLYRHLRRLLETGLVSKSEDPPPGTEDDERRKAYYSLTPLGEAVVRVEGLRLAGLVRQTRRLGLLPDGAA